MDILEKLPETLPSLIRYYLVKQDMSLTDFCKNVPISRSYAYQIMESGHSPSKRIGERIRRYIIDTLVEKQKNS